MQAIKYFCKECGIVTDSVYEHPETGNIPLCDKHAQERGFCRRCKRYGGPNIDLILRLTGICAECSVDNDRYWQDSQ